MKTNKDIEVKNVGGRPGILNDEIQADIIKYIRSGAYIETASAAAGVSKDSFYRWLKKGKRLLREAQDTIDTYIEDHPNEPPTNTSLFDMIDKGDVRYARFSDAITKAIAEAEIRDVAIIANAAPKNWQAAAWRLERKHPDRWGRQERKHVLLNGEVGVVSRVAEDQKAYEEAVGSFFGLTADDETEEDDFTSD